MPSYKLKYFKARGVVEVPRLLFVLAGQDYEDIRIDYETEWKEEKAKTPFGQLPMLEVDGKQYCQSSAISRYLARTFGFYGTNNIEALQVDQVLGIMQDVMNVMGKIFQEKDETSKAQFTKEAKEEKLPMYFGMLEKILKDNKSSGYFVGDKLSLADVMVFDWGQKIEDLVNYDDFPLVKKSRGMVAANPKIAAWLKKRPVTKN